MFSYSVKLHHAMITAAIALLLMAATAYTEKPQLIRAWMTGFWIFFTLTVIVVVLLLMSGVNDQTREQTDWMKEYGKLDAEGRSVMSLAFPTMRYRVTRGRAHPYFEDTFVPIETFQTFLKNSDKLHIMPERNCSSGTVPLDDWIQIKEWLEEHGRVKRDSAAGSHSWEWIGHWYDRCWSAYGMAGHELRYASETEGQELA